MKMVFPMHLILGPLLLNFVIAIHAFADPSIYQESPVLRGHVKSGQLPPVAQRLPDEPMVIRPYERIGVYGGQMRVLTGRGQELTEMKHMLYAPLLRFAADGKTIVPNVAKHWEMSEDGRVFTIYLRKGMKWSDGTPLTVEDVLFAWEDVYLNEQITPMIPTMFCTDNEPMKIVPVDKYTFRMTFTEPYGSLAYFLTRTHKNFSLVLPKHYLKRYHPRYTPSEILDEMAKERGFDFWFELFKDVNFSHSPLSAKVPPDYPTLQPWRVAKTPAIGHVILERNPYYWQVDPEGNQLPYIDEVHSQHVGNPEARNIAYASGEIDFGALFVQFENSPLFLSNQKKGGYRVFFWKVNHGTRVAYYFNLTNEDPEKRRIFQDRRFRIALSHAIDREEINHIVYFDKCMPRQDTVNRVCSFFEPEFETAHIEYDPSKAETILDQIGLNRKGPSGWRAFPNGQTLVITLDVFQNPAYERTAELLKEYWRSVGILLNYRTLQGALINMRVSGNKFDLIGYPNDCATDVMVLNQPVYGIQYWAPLWYLWLQTHGTQREWGEEPPLQIKRLHGIWSRMRRTTDDEERIRLGKQLIRSQAENLWGIGTVGETLATAIVSNRLHNVPQWMQNNAGQPIVGKPALWGWPWLATFLHHPEQWFIEQIEE